MTMFENNKIISILLIITFIYLAIGMHIVTPTPGGASLYLTSNIIGWIIFSLLISLGFWQLTLNKVFYYSPFQILLFISLTLLYIPFLYSNSANDLAIPRLLALAAGFLLLSSLTQLTELKKHTHQILMLLLLGIFIEAIIGCIQLYIAIPFNVNLATYSTITNLAFGSFIQPNVMASFLVTGIALSLYLLQPHFQIKNTKCYKFIIYSCLFLCPLLIITLKSRTGYLAAILVLSILTPFIYQNRKSYKKALVLLALGGVCALLTLASIQDTDNNKKMYNTGHRSTIYQVSADMILEKPITGFGYGTFERQYREHHLNMMKGDATIEPPLNDLGHPHNEVLLWVVEGGVLPLFAIILFAFAYLRLLRHGKFEKAPLISLIVPILLHTQTEYPFYHSVVHWLYFIVFLWLTEQSLSKPKAVAFNNTLVIKLSSILLPFSMLLVMLTTLHTSFKMENFRQSEFKDIAQVKNIINTFTWKNYIDMTLFTQGLLNGYQQKDPQALIRYINWGVKFVEHTPRQKVYQNMLIAIQTLEENNHNIDSQLKSKITGDAIRLYPSFFNKAQ